MKNYASTINQISLTELESNQLLASAGSFYFRSTAFAAIVLAVWRKAAVSE
jgi:hypothetical protein